MKKVISVLLAVMMLFSAMATVAFAEGEGAALCTCDDHKASPAGSCHCCVLCPNIDKSYLTSCAKDGSKDGLYDGSLCCGYCTGIFPCSCGCACCDPEDDEKGNRPIIGWWDEIWNQEAQDDFVDGFQKILRRISDVFDNIFDTIFEFLRLDDLLGSRQ